MTTRTKLALCAGLLAVAVGVAVVVRSPTTPDVEGRFVRYEKDGTAVLDFTNRGQSTVLFMDAFVGTNEDDSVALFDPSPAHRGHLDPIYALEPENGVQLVARTPPLLSLPARISAHCVPKPSELRNLVEDILVRIGVNVDVGLFLVTVDLPPRDTNAPAQPVTP